MPEWNSYDAIAVTYEKLAAQNSRRVARDLVALIELKEPACVLDLGAGTGVAGACVRERWPSAVVIGADVSLAMLRVGIEARRGWTPVVASALQLPFRNATFDLVVANFVLSHLNRPGEALVEVRRRLRTTGCIAASAWGAGGSGPGQRWQQLAVEFSDPQFVADAIAEVIPSEALFSDRNTFEQVLRSAGLRSVTIISRTYSYRWPMEDYLRDREATAVGRRLHTALPAERWSEFQAETRRIFSEEFGPHVEYSRTVLLATAQSP